ncbi:MAG: hypothetical protein ACFFAS_05135 [Promethearchaeota archaeon]
MSKINLKYFGVININTNSAEEEYHSTEINLDGKIVSISLSFNGKAVDSESFEVVQDFLKSLNELQSIAEKGIKKNFKDGGMVKYYIDKYLEDWEYFNERVLREILREVDKTEKRENQLLAALKLVHVRFHDDVGGDFSVIMDYAIDQDIDDWVVVNINKDKKIDYITLES